MPAAARRLALLVVGPDVVGGSQRCEVEMFKHSSLEYLAHELESQLQFFSEKCMINMIEVFDYKAGQYKTLQGCADLEDRARLRVRCARSATSGDGSGSSQYDKQNQQQQQGAGSGGNYLSSGGPAQFPPPVDRELDAKAEEIRRQAASPEALRKFQATTPDYGGPQGRATMIGKTLPVSSSSAHSNASSGAGSASLDAAKRVGACMSYLNGPISGPGFGDLPNGHSYHNSAASTSSVASRSTPRARRGVVGSSRPTSAASSSRNNNKPYTLLAQQHNTNSGSTTPRGGANTNNNTEDRYAHYKQQASVYANDYRRSNATSPPPPPPPSPPTSQQQPHQFRASSPEAVLQDDRTTDVQEHAPHYSPNTNSINNSVREPLSSSRQRQQHYEQQQQPQHLDRPQAYYGQGSTLPDEMTTIFCVYNGNDCQRAKALSVSRRRPDYNVVLSTLESKFQMRLCLGYIDPDTGDCEEVRSQKQFAEILNEKSHRHDPNAGVTFQCWMRVPDDEAEPDDFYHKYQRERNVAQTGSRPQSASSASRRHQQQDQQKDQQQQEQEQLSYSSSASRQRPRVVPGPISSNMTFHQYGSPTTSQQQQPQHTQAGAGGVSPPSRVSIVEPSPPSTQYNNSNPRGKTVNNNNNPVTRVSQHALQRLQELEAEESRRKLQHQQQNSTGGGGGGVRCAPQQQHPRRPRSTASVISLQSASVLVTDDQLRDVFDELDQEGTGFVTKAAVRHYFDQNVDPMGVPDAGSRFEKMLATANRRHELSFDEFSLVMLKVAQW